MANKLNLNLSGGMNSKTSPLILKDSECELLLNYSLDKIGSLTKRSGYEKYLNAVTDARKVKGIYQSYDMSAGTRKQIMAENHSDTGTTVLLYNEAGVWAGASGGFSVAVAKFRFASFVDFIFRVTGADEVASSSNGGAYWDTINCPSTITPTYISVFQDRVYLANESTSGENRSRIWFSSLPVDGTSITWDLNDDWFDVNPDDNDEITALENNGNRLLIFKNRALYRWTFGQVEADRLIGVGTSSQESVKTNLDLGITFFANPNGIYAYMGGRPKIVSSKIQNFIEAVSDWEEVFAEVDKTHYYLSVGNITVDNRTYSNAMFVYNIPLDAWSIYTFAVPVVWLGKYMPTGVVEHIYFGSNDAQIYKLFTGTDDDGSEINGEIVFKEHLLSFPHKNSVKFIDVFANKRVNSKAFYRLDRNEKYVPLGDLKDRITSFRTGADRESNTVQVKLTDTSKNTSVIEGYNIEYEPKAKRN